MARITVEDCLEKVESRFDLVLKASERARDLISTSSEPLREIAEGVLDEDYVPPSDTEEGDTEEEFLDNVDEE